MALVLSVNISAKEILCSSLMIPFLVILPVHIGWALTSAHVANDGGSKFQTFLTACDPTGSWVHNFYYFVAAGKTVITYLEWTITILPRELKVGKSFHSIKIKTLTQTDRLWKLPGSGVQIHMLPHESNTIFDSAPRFRRQNFDDWLEW